VTGPSLKTRAGYIFLLIGAYFLGSNTSFGLPESHSPFFPGQDHTSPMKICKPLERKLENLHPALGSVTFSAPDGRRLKLDMATLAEPYSENYFATITDDGQEITSRVDLPLIATVVSLLPTEAICQDLNGDGISDFITTHSLHGNGLGARFHDRLVVLSSGDTAYRFWIVRTMDPSPLDFQLLGESESLVMLTTSFANSGGARPHSYYVYDLWTFLNDQLVAANSIDHRFPKWVWMTLSENHKPATSLSSTDKQQMLAPRSAREIVAPEIEVD
jgi:hypothetical protein